MQRREGPARGGAVGGINLQWDDGVYGAGEGQLRIGSKAQKAEP